MPFVYPFDHRHDARTDRAQGPARRQGRRPRRDDLGARAARAARASPSRPRPAAPTWPAGVARRPRRRDRRRTLDRLEATMGRRLGDPSDPLLVSVRSGAAFSMPGMMDTVLNLGLNDESVEGLAKQTGDERFALRLVPSLHRDVRPHRPRRRRRDASTSCSTPRRDLAGVSTDAEIPAELLRYLASAYQRRRRSRDRASRSRRIPTEQLRQAIEAVFRPGTAPGRSPTATASTSRTTSAPR